MNILLLLQSMTSNVQKCVDCLICREAFEIPTRNLRCGHTFCEKCLIKYSSNPASVSCPTCREETPLDPTGVKSLSRNWSMESVIEYRERSCMPVHSNNSSANGQTCERMERTSLEWSPIKDEALKHMKEKNFVAAIKSFRVILRQLEGYHKLKYMVSLLKCLMETNETQESWKICEELDCIISSQTCTTDAKESCTSCDDEMRRLAQTFISKDYKTSILLNRCSYKIAKIFYNNEEKLERLGVAALVMSKIAQEMKRDNKIEEFEEQLPFMEEILAEMRRTTCDDEEFACLRITNCLQRIGRLYNDTSFYGKSIEMHKQAIDLMRNVFNNDAEKHKVYGDCYSNLGIAYFRTDQPEEAKKTLMQAKELCESATDWSNNEQKERSITHINDNLQIVSNSTS